MTATYLNLDTIYNETGGDEWTNKTKWLSHEPIHEWHGVTLETNTENSLVVNKLILSNNNLKGLLQSPWNTLFTSLQIVDLSHNKLSGSILGILDGLTQLTELRLNDNHLNGFLPLLLSLAKVEILDLSHNQFDGSIPDEYGLLTSLQELRLTSNKLTSCTDELKNLTQIKKLYLDENEFSGPFPSWIVELVTLEELDIGQNQLTGDLPENIYNLSELRLLGLGEINFKGNFPRSVCQLMNLERLWLFGSQHHGEIPSSIDRLCQLTELDLSNNQLAGEIPSSIGQLSQLKVLILSNNKLTGEIPSSIGRLIKLENLFIDTNLIRGEIPSSIFQLSQLTELSLHTNLLTGEIPSSIGQLSQLVRLALFKNQLTGEIPSSIGQLSHLSELYLSNNKLTGEIPSSIGQLSQLVAVDLLQNRLGGEIPSSIGQLSQLTELILSANKLTGEIPSSIGQLSQLTELYATNNKLTGEIPSSIGQLSQLTELDLSCNQLTGEIPASIGRLTQLTGLSISENQLSGEIPSSIGQLSQLIALDLSVNKLTGELSDIAWNSMDNLKYLRLQENDFSGMVPLSLIDHQTLNKWDLNDNQFNRNFDADISSLSWDEQKYWYTNYDVNEAMFEACKKGYMRIIKYLIESKNYSNFLQKDKDGKHALDYLLQSNPYGALTLFMKTEIHESDNRMFKQFGPGIYIDDNYVENQFQYNLRDGEYCIRGSDSRIIDRFWFRKIGEMVDVRQLIQKYFYLTRVRNLTKTFWSTCTFKVDKVWPNLEHDLNLDDDVDIYMLLNSLRSSTSYPVTSYTLPFECMSSVEFLHFLVTLFDKTGDIRLYENENVKIAILAAWEGYGRTYHVAFMFYYLGFLGLFVYSNYFFQIDEDSTITIILSALSALLLVYEISQLIKMGARRYLSDYENVMEVSGTILFLIGCTLQLSNYEGTDILMEIMAIASILLWLNALNYLRPFKLTGSLIRLVFKTIEAILPFLLIFAIVLFGFSQAFYLLSYGDSNFVDFASPDVAFLNAFAYVTNQSTYHIGQSSKSNVMTTLQVVFITLAQILLLNLLIAFLNNIYSDIQSKAEAQMLSQRCHIIVSQFRFWSVSVPRYMHYLKKNSDVEKHKKSLTDMVSTNGEIVARIDEVEKQIKISNADSVMYMSTMKVTLRNITSQIHHIKEDVQTIKQLTTTSPERGFSMDHSTIYPRASIADMTAVNNDNTAHDIMLHHKIFETHNRINETNCTMETLSNKVITTNDMIKTKVDTLSSKIENIENNMEKLLEAFNAQNKKNKDNSWIKE